MDEQLSRVGVGSIGEVRVVAEHSNIDWTDSTFNPWIGCMKVSAGCDHCFAENLMDTRYGRVEWGQRKTETTTPSVGTRSRTSPSNWRKPVQWNKNFAEFQAKHGRRQRVFCASLADVFDNQVPWEWRIDLFNLIAITPNLDWLLLTKRPENIRTLRGVPMEFLPHFPNIWIGTTAEDQASYDRRWPILRDIKATVRFISYEPAIGPLWIHANPPYPDWLIAGGESGHGFRRANPQWFDHIMEECQYHDVAFFMKQMAGLEPIPQRLMLRQFPKGA